MTTLDFKDGLTVNTFVWGNYYQYNNLESLNLFFSHEENFPYIFRGGKLTRGELMYSSDAQLNRRTLTAKRIQEVMDTSRIPLKFYIKGNHYLIGKGFLSTYSDKIDDIEILFIAVIRKSVTISSMEQVSFYVSRKIYDTRHKVFHKIIKELMGTHRGDIMICNNIHDYVGDQIEIPKGGTLKDRVEHKERIINTIAAGLIVGSGTPLREAPNEEEKKEEEEEEELEWDEDNDYDEEIEEEEDAIEPLGSGIVADDGNNPW